MEKKETKYYAYLLLEWKEYFNSIWSSLNGPNGVNL